MLAEWVFGAVATAANSPTQIAREAASFGLGKLATSMVMTFFVVVTFAVLTALMSQALIDLILRRWMFSRAFEAWKRVGDKLDVDVSGSDPTTTRLRPPKLPRAAFDLPIERFCALISNHMRADLEICAAADAKSKGVDAAMADRRDLRRIDRAVDELQATLITTTRRMRYAASLILALILLLGTAWVLGQGTESAMSYMLAILVPVAVLASWIQGLELRAIRTT